MGGASSTYGVSRGICRVLVGKPERERPLGKQRRRWEDIIKIYLRRVRGGYGLD